MQKLREKDQEALKTIMEQYGDLLLRTAYLLVRDQQAAEEAVQDTFITAFHKIDQLQDAAKLKSWLTRITINRCRMKQRTWDWRHLFPFARIEPEHNEAEEMLPDDYLLKEWRNAKLSDAIHKLKYSYREAIILYYYNELSIQEIVESTGANVNTVKARLARGRAQLKVLLTKGGFEDERG
ncbi:MAG: polymerase ECF-type sigma factor [Paenibacillus sp.]|nr:polymerase ECF-type sigma factor [Paenibacillus sp.]